MVVTDSVSSNDTMISMWWFLSRWSTECDEVIDIWCWTDSVS